MKTQNASTQYVAELVKQFDQYQKFLEQAGKTVRRSPRDQAIQMFGKLSEAQQAPLNRRLKSELEVMAQMTASKERMTDSGQQLWRYLKLNGLTPCSDLFDKISSDDMVQVYSPEQFLLFASTNIFDYISFTMEQLYTQTWYESTIRDPNVEQKLAETVMRILSGAVAETISPGAPLHMIEEVGTEKRLKSEMDVKWMSPVFSDSKVAAITAIVGCKLK